MDNYLHTALTAPQAAAIAVNEESRTPTQRLAAIYARETVIEDIEKRLERTLRLFIDPTERRLVIDGIERIAQRARAKEAK